MRWLVALLGLLSLAGCGSAGYSEHQRVENERYLACINAGGSYEKDDVDYACTMPGTVR